MHSLSPSILRSTPAQLNKADLQMYDELCSILSSAAVCHTSMNM